MADGHAAARVGRFRGLTAGKICPVSLRVLPDHNDRQQSRWLGTLKPELL
jgi:hypothetical protein